MEFNSDFLFGLESEYILLESETFKPLWYEDLDFHELDSIFQSIYTADISSSGLSLQAPHSQNSPFLVEGYHCYTWSGQPHSILPKGIEIRTPIFNSLEDTLKNFSKLYQRLSQHLMHEEYRLCSLSFHPTQHEFKGPKQNRDSTLWNWAQIAMCTYGPDINIQIPEELLTPQFWDSLPGKVYYYAPALSASSFSSPFYLGHLWETECGIGQSARTFSRAGVAPLYEFHGREQGRFECNIFEMPNSLTEFRCYFLLWLTLLLDSGLPGRASESMVQKELIQVAQSGLSQAKIRARGLEVIEAAFKVLPQWGFDPSPLNEYSQRFCREWNPSVHLQNIFYETGSLKTALFERCYLAEAELQKSSTLFSRTKDFKRVISF